MGLDDAPETGPIELSAGRQPQSAGQGSALEGQLETLRPAMQIGTTTGFPLLRIDHRACLPDDPQQLGLGRPPAAPDTGTHRAGHHASLRAADPVNEAERAPRTTPQ